MIISTHKAYSQYPPFSPKRNFREQNWKNELNSKIFAPDQPVVCSGLLPKYVVEGLRRAKKLQVCRKIISWLKIRDWKSSLSLGMPGSHVIVNDRTGKPSDKIC